VCKRDEVTGEWRKLHSEEINDLYYSPNIFRLIKSRIMRWEGKRRFARPRLRWEDNIEMDLQEVGCGDMDWIDLAQDRDRVGHLYLPL